LDFVHLNRVGERERRGMTHFKGRRCWRSGCLVLGVILGLSWTFPAQAQVSANKCYERNYTFNFLAENDLWGSGSDKHFTHGTRLSFVESREEVGDAQSCTPQQREIESGGLDFIRNIFGPTWKDSSTQTSHVSFILGQNIFTPEDITNPNLIVNDRPYAGWLYVGIGLIKRHKTGRIAVFDTLELDLGIVGPEAFAQDIQTWWHKNISNSPRPAGWDNQLKNEPGILVNLERKWRMELTPQNYEGMQVDFLPSVGAALGNVYTYASVGGMFRLGVNLPVDYGPPRIRPGAQGSDFFQYDKKKPVSWYVYAGAEGRVLATNIFLDGNTVADSHSVDKKYFVGDVHAGFVLVIYRARLAFSQVFRSSEFNGQKELSEFGSINLSVTW
jgi:lipid A 3-O-deacylase